jgi:Tol biopolymer transport system component
MSGRILFTSNRDGAHQLYVLSLADDKISRLTRSGEDDWEPSWGSDGRIAFTCCRSGNCNICVANSDGSGESVLVTRPEWDDHPAWWPNGRYIAFSTTGEIDGAWHAQIHKVDLTGNLSRLTFAQSEERYPAWSPDGAWIAFDSERDGNRGIYKMRADGSDVTRLTHDGAFDEQAAWSPDGSQIAFIRKTVDTDGGGIGRDDFGDILVMDSDGSSPHPLTSCNCAVDPRWSPDGRWIVYARGDSNKTHGSMLWALRVSDGFQVQLTTGPRDWRPAWAW